MVVLSKEVSQMKPMSEMDLYFEILKTKNTSTLLSLCWKHTVKIIEGIHIIEQIIDKISPLRNFE